MQVQSSIFSFVDFNPAPVACNDGHVNLPAVNNFAIKFQVKLLQANAGIQPWAVPVYGGGAITAAKTRMKRLCGRLSFPIPLPAFPLTITKSGPGSYVEFDDGYYVTAQDFVDNLNSKDEFEWILGNSSIYTDSCCIPVFNGNIHVIGTGSFTYTGELLLDYMNFYASIPGISMAGIIPLNCCFTYGIYSKDPQGFPSSHIAFSNHFCNSEPSCYLTYVDYFADKNIFDFDYSCDVHNTAWLPMYFMAPNNPTTETIYQESSGKRRVRSSSMDEEYVLKTDYVTQWLHRKIEAMLQHGDKFFTNTFYEITADNLTKKDQYAKDWNNELPVAVATGKTKLIKNLTSFNGSCCLEFGPCCDNIDPACGQLSTLDISTDVFGGNIWAVNIIAATFSSIPSGNQVVEILYRERYLTGPYISAGTITFNPAGAIVSVANPFIIAGLDPAWQAIELKAVNGCGSDDLDLIIFNPCETMAGIIGTTFNSGPVTTWTVSITDVIYSNWPPFGVTKTIDVEYREYGGAGIFISAGSFDVTVAAGYVVTLVPDPFEITGLPDIWEKVEVKFSYGCEKQFTEVFVNPSGCKPVSVVTISDIEATGATASWPAVSPTPGCLYDWELRHAISDILIDGGTGYWNPGTLIISLTGLPSGSSLKFRVRANCCDDSYSSWTEKTFSTI